MCHRRFHPYLFVAEMVSRVNDYPFRIQPHRDIDIGRQIVIDRFG